MDELISIIVPVYNNGLELNKCINSILKQTYENLQIIVVDDGSDKNDTKDMLFQIAVIDPLRIEIYHKCNGGAASARNFGISKARGKYIAFVDSDDYIDNDMYRDLICTAKKYDVKLVVGDLEIGSKDIIKKSDNDVEYVCEDALRRLMLGKWHSPCTNLYIKDLFEDLKFPEGETNEDYILNFNIIAKLEKIAYNKNIYYHYIKREDSVTGAPANNRNLDWLKHTAYVKKYIFRHVRFRNLISEAEYQWIFSNVVLINKALISIANGYYDESEVVYQTALQNILKLKTTAFLNQYFSLKYRIMTFLILCFPALYRNIILLFLRIKNNV